MRAAVRRAAAGTVSREAAAAVAEAAAAETARSSISRPYADNYAVLVVKEYETGKILCASDHFILASLSEPDQERSSFRLTFGDPTLFVGAGRNPRLFAYSGFLVDSLSSGPGIAQWRKMYDEYFRGTQCAKKRAAIQLLTRDFSRKGFMMSCAIAPDATRPQIASLSFNMFVIGEYHR